VPPWWVVLGILVLAAIFVASATLVPIVGILRASRRLQQRRRSNAAVTWAGINALVFGLMTLAGFSTGKFHPIVPGGLVLNGLWLAAAVRANRAARNGPSP
jgi:NO-binding membrane sensor protein with MHYT domain